MDASPWNRVRRATAGRPYVTRGFDLRSQTTAGLRVLGSAGDAGAGSVLIADATQRGNQLAVVAGVVQAGSACGWPTASVTTIRATSVALGISATIQVGAASV